MRRKIQKVRCTKIKLAKCKEVCRLYDKVQESFARILSADEAVTEFATNVPLDFSKVKLSADLAAPKEPHTTDFFIRQKDGRRTILLLGLPKQPLFCVKEICSSFYL